uniref:Uncharacterized protein n=1 Tax=Anguilla anguilla TaxID=7936 RepID=A0A0E9RMN9_ANGAN
MFYLTDFGTFWRESDSHPWAARQERKHLGHNTILC